MPSAKSHKWFRVKEHCYLCVKCGTGKRHEHQTTGVWQQRFFLPNGGSVVRTRVPPCESGVFTVERIRRHELAIDNMFSHAAAAQS